MTQSDSINYEPVVQWGFSVADVDAAAVSNALKQGTITAADVQAPAPPDLEDTPTDPTQA